jgi:hypothetical protein
MLFRRSFTLWVPGFLTLGLLSGLVSTSWAQAPSLSFPLPNGIPRGSSLDLTLTGTNLANPTGLWTGFPGKITIPTEDKNGQDNAKLKVRLEVPADVPLGYHGLRLATTKGISNLRLFCVDDLPQVLENDKNNSRGTAQALPIPCVVIGKADAEQGDFFKVTVQAGQRLSFDLLGRRIGSQADAHITLFNAKTQRELAYNNDSPGCQSDPRLTYTFKEAGDYLVEVRDVLNRGGADYVYRLRIGDFPLATAPIPMAAKAGSKVKVGFVGPNVEGVPPVDIAVPTDGSPAVWVAPKGPSGLHGWPVALAISNLDELVEQEPNNEPAKANRLPVPGGITGRFQQSDDLDCYLVSGKKGQKLLIEAQTLELYSPTLVFMVVKNAKTGAELAKSNTAATPPADQRIEFTPTEDADFLLEVQHLNFAGGPNEIYRVTITPPTPSFDLNLATDRYDMSPGSVVPILVQVARKGYTGPIELSLSGTTDVTGSATIKAGQNSGIIVAAAKDNAPLGPHNITVQGKATIEGKSVVQKASVRGVLSQNLAGLLYPPLHLNNQVGLAVREKGPITLVAKLEHPEGAPGLGMQVTLTATREKGFTEEITLNPPTGLPANVPAPKIPPIPKDKNEVKFALDLNAKAPVGEYVIVFSGKSKKEKTEVAVSAIPLVLIVGAPFDLKMEPENVTLTPGGKAKVKVTATRKGGYKGPIALEVRKLPANVTASKAAIDMAKDVAEIELSAAPTAAPVERIEIDVNGTATALNNLANASPGVNLRVEKK